MIVVIPWDLMECEAEARRTRWQLRARKEKLRDLSQELKRLSTVLGAYTLERIAEAMTDVVEVIDEAEADLELHEEAFNDTRLALRKAGIELTEEATS